MIERGTTFDFTSIVNDMEPSLAMNDAGTMFVFGSTGKELVPAV